MHTVVLFGVGDLYTPDYHFTALLYLQYENTKCKYMHIAKVILK